MDDFLKQRNIHKKDHNIKVLNVKTLISIKTNSFNILYRYAKIVLILYINKF